MNIGTLMMKKQKKSMGVIHKSTMYIRRIEVNWVVMSMAQKICKIFYPLLDTSRAERL